LALAQEPRSFYPTALRQRLNQFDVLAACPLTSAAAEGTLLELSTHSRHRHYPPKTAIYWQGDKAETVFVLVAGTVRLSSSCSDGRVHSSSHVALFDIFGETATLARRRREHTAWVLDEAAVWEIDGDAFRHAVTIDPALCFALVRLLSDRSIDRNHDNASKRAPLHRRVGQLLLEHAHSDGLIRITHGDLASHLGVSREAVTRALARLKGLNVIVTHRHGIRISDYEGLAFLLSRDE